MLRAGWALTQVNIPSESPVWKMHVIMLLTLPSDWQDLHVPAFFLHLGNPYTFLKASQRPSLGGALPSSVSLTPSLFVFPIFLYVAAGVVTMAQCNL